MPEAQIDTYTDRTSGPGERALGEPDARDRHSLPSGIRPPRRFRAAAAGVAAAMLAAGCGGGGGGTGGGDSPPQPPPATTVAAPTTLGVYPVAGSSAVPTRIYVIVSTVGALPVRLPVALDTGSAGLTLNALTIFPSSLVTSSGFAFASGQSTLSYQGIAVTNQQGSRAYGGPNGHTQIGNIGFAPVTFGDSSGTFTTRTMPVFFYYQILSTATQQPVSETAQQGWFGVNDAPNQIVVSGGTAPYPACAMDAIGSCWAVGVFKYLNFAAGIDAGFVTAPVQIATCDITSDGDCTSQPAVTIGLDASARTGFSLSPLPCPPPTYTVPA